MEENNTAKTDEGATTSSFKRLVGVQFSPAGKVHTFSAEDHQINIYDLVVVEGDKGPVVGSAATPVFERKAEEVATNIKKVLKKADAEDTAKYQKNREEAMKFFDTCQQKVAEMNLPMKLVDVDVLTDDTKAIFYFTAEERVDFRKLVKDLATLLHMRIEMRQIGARDAAKSIGGIGSCGLVCCCESHLREFKSIAIQMAKNQCLSPNPTKLTGMCGKLKCCLFYENDMYSEFKADLPTIGSTADTPEGKGIVSNLDVPRQLVYIRIEETNKEACFRADEITIIKREKGKRRDKKGKQNGAGEEQKK